MRHLRTAATLAALCALAWIMAHYEPAGLGGVALAYSWPVVGRTLETLKKMSNPHPTPGGISEALPWWFYDTQTYTDNTTTTLTFFQTVNNNKSLSNMAAGGQLQDPQYFEIYGFCLDPLADVSAADPTVAWTDVQSLLYTGVPRWSFTVSDKVFGPFPASILHQTGGVNGFGYNLAGTTAVGHEYAQWGIFDGGAPVDGAIVIPPKVSFDFTLTWPTAVDISGDLDLRVVMYGTLHRRVL